MLKRFWAITAFILIMTTLGTHVLVAFTQSLPPYYNCIRLQDVQVSINRRLHHFEEPSVFLGSLSPDGKWQIRQHYTAEIIPTFLENTEDGRRISLPYEFRSLPQTYWSPDSQKFMFLNYVTNSDNSQYTYYAVIFSIDGHELAHHDLQISHFPVVMGWSNTGQHVALRSADFTTPQREWLISVPDFELQSFNAPFAVTSETNYRVTSYAWSHTTDRLAYIVGNTLLLLDPSSPTLTITLFTPRFISISAYIRQSIILWSPDDRYLAIATHIDDSDDFGLKNLYVFDTQGDTLTEVMSRTISIDSAWQSNVYNTLFWPNSDTLFIVQPHTQITNYNFMSELMQVNLLTGDFTTIYPEISHYNSDKQSFWLVRPSHDNQVLERYTDGQWIEMLSLPIGQTTIQVTWIPFGAMLTVNNPASNSLMLHIIDDSGHYYSTPFNAHLTRTSFPNDYIGIIVTDDTIQWIELLNLTTFEIFRQPPELSFDPNRSGYADYFIIPSPDGKHVYISLNGNGYLITLADNTWHPLLPDRQLHNAMWSPDSQRIIFQEFRPDFFRQLWAYELADGQLSDIGYFPQNLFGPNVTFDQCADLLTILRNT